jgi:3-isopropylmalate/(R)-2-methylmalate dehydratase large subunit
MTGTLYEKVLGAHTVSELAPGLFQVYVDLHLVNEVSSPQAFGDLCDRRLRVAHPELTLVTADHSVASSGTPLDTGSSAADLQVSTLIANARQHGLPLLDPGRGEHGILHVVAPERGMIWPGRLVVCGDSHTSTHGAFGALAYGIGTTNVRDVLATQSMAVERLEVRRIDLTGNPGPRVTAKDVALSVITRLGADSGLGYAYEFGGPVVEAMSMEERMTLCNLAIEAGARVGYVNPDQTTFDYLRGREHAPADAVFEEAVAGWQAWGSEPDAQYDDLIEVDLSRLEPMVSWGVSPDQCVPVTGRVPDACALEARPDLVRAADFMGFAPGEPVLGRRIDVGFIGSCTNGRTSDLLAAAEIVRELGGRVPGRVRALVVPGSERVYDEAVSLGLDVVFRAAGFDFRHSGCSLCCGMNEDRLQESEVCASSSNRNFRGRQGAVTGKTLLMSAPMVAAAALAGEVVDIR